MIEDSIVRLQKILAVHGGDSSFEKATEVMQYLRLHFGVLFSAADCEWNEDRLLNELERQIACRTGG